MEKSIQDAVHGVIKLDDWMIRIIDTPQFQRIRRIKQLGFANLVYPGANHTRFEHSLGVLHITSMLKEKLELDDVVLAAALLHDIAHGPFSHCSEALLEKYGGFTHENISKAVKGELKDVLNELGFRLKEIEAIVTGKKKSVVSGEIDVDRMDYLVRDSHYTGVAYGVFDIYRLIDKIDFDEGVIIKQGGIKAAESLLISRFLMYPTVYSHHVCRIARKMYERAMERVIEDGFEVKRLLEMDDIDALILLKEREKEVFERLQQRRLYKRAIYVSRKAVDFREIMRVNERRAEREIAEMAGVDESKVIVDIPPLEKMEESEVRVATDDGIKTLSEISPLVRSLKEAALENWRLGVYTEKDYVDAVGKAAMEFFGIEKSVQKSLDEIFPE